MIMRNLLLVLTVFLATMILSGCGGSGVKSVVDPKILENKAEVQGIYDAIVQCMGSQVSKADEISISIDNPADKGKTGDAYLHIMVDMQDSENPKQLIRQQFHGELGYWMAQQSVTIDLKSASDEEKMNFRLEDTLFDFSTDVPFEKLFKVMQDAYAKSNTESDKYSYLYIEDVTITIEGYNINVKGKLASNDQMLNDRYEYDLGGNLIRAM
jgi:hypothetical protein